MKVSEFINTFEHKDFLNGKYRADNWKEILPGANLKEFKDLSDAANKYGQNISNLLQTLEAEAQAQGLQVDVHEDHGNITVSYLLPKQSSMTPEEIRKDLSIPQFHLSVDKHGVGLRNGLKTLNQNVLDTWKGELILYTKSEKLLREEIRKFQAEGNTNFKRNIKRGVAGDASAMRSAANSVKYTAKLVQQKLASVGDYKALNDEAWKARQGTGSKQSLLARRGFTDVRPVIQSLLQENKQLVKKYRQQNNAQRMSFDRVESEIEKDIMQLLTIYGQNMQLDKIEQEIKSTNKFKYLFDKGNFEKTLRAYGKQINKMHPYIGTSQESSVDNFLMSFIKNSDLGYMGALDDRSSRKRVQVSNTYSTKGIRESARKAKQELTKEGVVFTKAQSQNDISKEDLETRMYGLLYATQEEISAAQEAAERHIAQKLLDKTSEESRRALRKVKKGEEQAVAAAMAGKGLGSHSGGIFYSKEVEKSLDAVQERFKTISNEDVLNRINILRKSDRKNIKKLNDKQLEDRAIRELLADASGMSRRDFYKILQGYNIEARGEKDDYRINYQQARHMHSGTKILTSSDYDRNNAQAIDPEVLTRLIMGRSSQYGYKGDVADTNALRSWAQDFIKTNKISMLKTQDSVNARNFSGYLENYLNGVFDYLRSTGNTNPFAGKSDKFKNWLTYKNGQFIVNQDIFSGNKTDKKVLEELIRTVNDILPAGNLYKDVFSFNNGNDIKDGIDIDFSRLIGYTAANQFNTYDYGSPGKTVTADYRYKGAVERGMAGASLAHGINFSALNQFKRNYLQGDAKDQQNLEKYKQKQQEVKDLIKKSRATQSKDFAYGANDIIMSYNGIDGRRALVLDANGNLVYKDTIDDKTGLGEAYKAGSAGYIDLSYDYKTLSAEDYDRQTGKVKRSGLKGTIYDAIEQASKINKDGQLYYRPGTEGGAYYVSDGKHDIRGTAVALPNYNPQEWADKDGLVDIPTIFNQALRSVTHAEENYQRVLAEQEEGRPNQEQIDEAKQELMYSVAEMFGSVNDEVNNKNGSIFKWQKIKMGHSMLGTAEASSISNLGGDFEKNLLDTSALINTETMRELLKPQHLKLDGKEVGETQAEYNKVLKSYLQYMYGDNFEQVVRDYSEEYQSSDASKKTNAILEQLVIDSVTLGSEQFNKRKAESLKNGTVLRGLGGEFARFPLSNGLDVKDVEIFAGNKQLIDQDKIRVGLGLGQAVNADFDGDKLVLHLDMAEGKAYNGVNTKDLISQKQNSVDLQRKISAAVGAVSLSKLMEDMTLTDGKSTLSKKDLDILFNEQAQNSGAIASRLNKHYTGFLSNNYQGIVETMAKLNTDTLDPNNPETKDKFIEQMIVRGIFEGFTQDAISSKKVTQRIAKKHGKGFADSLGFLTELQDLMDVFSDEETFNNRSKFDQAFDKAKGLGLMDDGEAFSGRIAAQIIAYAQELYTKDGAVDKKGLARALHVNEKDIDNILFNYTYDKNGQVSAVSAGSTPNLSMDVVKDITWEYSKSHPGGLGWAQRNKGNRPGGISTASNPVYYLGENHISTAEYENLDDNLKKLVTTYDSLTGQALTAADAINAEAEAEKNKIGIATQEGKAITKLSDDYKGLVTNVSELEKTLSNKGTNYDYSVSNFLGNIFGRPFTTDTSGFENNLKNYIAKAGSGKDFKAITPQELGYTKEQFNEYGNAWLPTARGKIADSIEQVLGLAGRLGIKGLDNITNGDEFLSLLAAISSGGSEAKINGKSISWNSASKANKFIKSKEVEDLKKYIEEYLPMIRMIKGENAESYIDQIFGAGNAMWKTTLGLAGGNIKNVGSSEGYVKAYLSGDTSVHGRYDRSILNTSSQYRLDGMNDKDNFDLNTVTIVDKKFAQKPSNQYLAQVYAYIKSREQIRDYAIDNKVNKYEDFFGTDLGKNYLDKDGNKLLSEEEFYQLIGYQKKGRNWVQRDKNNQGAMIKGGLTITDNNGMSTYYGLGYNEFNSATGKSTWRFTQDKNADEDIKAYLASGGSIEEMPEYLKTIMGQAVHKATDPNLTFEYYKHEKTPQELQEEESKKLEEQQKQQNNDQKSIEKLLKEYEQSFKAQKQYELSWFKAAQENDAQQAQALAQVAQRRAETTREIKQKYQEAVDAYKQKYGETGEDFLLTPEQLAQREAESTQLNYTHGHDEYLNKKYDSIIKEAGSEYTQARRERTELLRQSALYSAKIDDKSGVYSKEEQDKFKELKEAIDEQITKVLDKKIEAIKNSFGEGGENAHLADRFKKEILNEVDPKQNLKEKNDKFNLERDAAAEIRRKQNSDRSEVYGAFNSYNNATYKVWEVEQRLAKENDEKKREYLENEKQALLEIQTIAKDNLEAVKTRRKDPYWNNLVATQGHRAGLGLQVRQNDYLARQKAATAAASAYRGGSKTDFLGIDASIIRWVDRLMSGGMMMRFFGMVKRGLNSLIQQAKALDKAMTNLRIVTNDTAANTKTLMNSYAKLGKELGATTLEVATSATEWLRQGYQAVEVNKLIEASMHLSKLGMIDSTTATKDLTSAMKGFKMEASEAMSIVDKLTAIDLKAATSAGEIAEGLSQFANLATLSGVNIDQAAAYVATIADVTQNSGSQVGASMKTIISRYGNVKAGAYNKLNTDEETSETAENLNDVERVLHKLNIDIRDSNLNFKDFDVVLDEIAEKWGTLDNVSKKAIANAFAGVRQQEAFVTLMENYDKYESLLETSENSAGTAEEKYQSYKDSYEAAKNTLTSTVQELVNNSNLNVVLTDLVKGVNWLIELFGKAIKYLPMLIAQFESLKTLAGKSTLQTMGYRMKDYFMGLDNNSLYGQKRVGFLASQQYKDSWANNSNWFSNTKLGQKLHSWSDKSQQKVVQKAEEAKVKAAKESTKLTDLELLKKKEIYKFASLEEAKKAGLVTDAKLEQAAKQGVLDAGKAEWIKKHGVLASGQLEAMEKAGIITKAEREAIEKQKTAHQAQLEADLKKQVAQSAQQEAAAGAVGGGVSGGSGKMSFGQKLKNSFKWKAGTSGGQKFSAALAGASTLATGIMAGITNFSTGAATHKYNGETVDSSEGARKAGRGYAMAGGFVSAIPVIGAILGPGLTHIAEAVAAKHDRDRDRSNAETKKASETIAGLTNIEGSIKSLGETPFGTTESQKNVDNFLKEIYSADNEGTRKVLDQYLGAHGTNVYSVLTKIKDNTADSAEAYRQLQLAELQAKKDQIAQKYASSLYKAQGKTNTAYSQYSNYSGVDASTIGAGVGVGLTVGAAGTALGAAAGLLAAGAANGWNPVGWVMLAAGAVAGIVGGVVAGVETSRAKEEKKRQEHAWTQISTTKKIAKVQEDMNKAMQAGDTETVKVCEDLLSALREQNAIVNQIYNEMNEITAQQGLISAYVTDTEGNKQYLSEMTTAQLKDLGLDKILLSYAQGLEANGGLLGRNIWSDASKTSLSDAGYDYLRSLLRNQGDDEINSILNGGAYSLEEALKLRKKFPNEKWVKDILESFATVLNVPIEILEAMEGAYGSLTLNELMMSTSDLNESISKYTDLLGKIGSGTGEVSAWMATIIDQFPDLIAYTSDLPTLFSKIGTKLNQLSKAYMNSQYEDVVSSEGFFKTIEEDFYEALSEGAAETLKGLGGTGANSISSVLSWLKTQYGADGELSDMGQEVLEKLKETVDEYGVEITSSVLKTYYDQLIDFKTQTLDKQLNNLNEQKQALQDINSQREYENKLIEAKLKLENASKEKKRVYRAGVGWVYESDQEAIKEAQENLTAVENEKTVSALEQQIAELEHQKTELEEIYNNENYETLSKLYDAFVDQAQKDGTNAETANGFLEAMLSGISGISENLSSLVQQDSDKAAEDKQTALAKAKEAWENLQSAAASGSVQEYNTALEAYHSAASAAQNAGATEKDMESWGTVDVNGKQVDAWNTAQGSKTEQLKDSLLQFILQDTTSDDGSGYWSGTVDLSNPEYSGKVLDDYIFGDIQKGKATVYDANGKEYKITKDDVRFKPKKEEKDFLTYANRMRTEQGLDRAVYVGWKGKNEAVYFYNGQAYSIKGKESDKIDHASGAFPGTQFAQPQSAATGSLGLLGGMSLINELGTEAIITPQGTLTALPSKTGIVPADVTKNLWALGEVAPSIMRVIQAHIAPDTIGKSSIITSNDDSFNIDNLTMHVNADNTFDADAFVDSIKSRIALTRNLKR